MNRQQAYLTFPNFVKPILPRIHCSVLLLEIAIANQLTLVNQIRLEDDLELCIIKGIMPSCPSKTTNCLEHCSGQKLFQLLYAPVR